MDEIVLRSIARWPDVPAVFGWLSLDRRGEWRIKGERITNRGLTEFIARNYARDETGRWYFQNGPQRVFVRVEFLPHIIRVEGPPGLAILRTMTGRLVATIDGVWLCDSGELVIGFDGDAALVDDRDLGRLLEHLVDRTGGPARDESIETAWLCAQPGSDTGLRLRLTSGDHRILKLSGSDVAARFGFVADPRPAPGQADC